MHKTDKRSVDIVDRNHVFTRLNTLNDHSAAKVDAGRVRAISSALQTAGKKSLSFRRSIKLVSDLDAVLGYAARAHISNQDNDSSAKLSML